VKNFRPEHSVAAAVALAIGAGSAFAATFNGGAAIYSQEYGALASPTAGQNLVSATTGGDVRFSLGAAYITGDSVTLTLSGAEFATGSTISVACDQTGGTSFSTTIGSSGSVTLDATTATFSVAAGIPATSQCRVSGAQVKNSSVAAVNTSGIKLALSVKRGADTTVDTAAATTFGTVRETLFMAVNATTGRLDGVILNYGGTATGQNGRIFSGATPNVDKLVTNITVLGAVNDVTLSTGTAFSIFLASNATGGLNWLNNGTAGEGIDCVGTGGNTASVSGGVGVISAGTTGASACSTINYRFTGATTNIAAANTDKSTVSTIDFTVAATGNQMVAQTFSVSSGQWNYSVGTASTTKVISFTPGAFTANGARVFVPYMPIGTGISPVVTVANTSDVAGTATISAIASSGDACSSANFGTVALAANKVTSLSSAVVTGLNTCFGSTTSRSVALTITVNAPAENVEVYSMYNVNGNRVPVVNSSNGKGNQNTLGVSTGNADY